MVQPRRSGGLTCSGEGCELAVEGCIHIWESRFRFGDLKNGNWAPPIKALRRKKVVADGESAWERHLSRPNPTVDGLKAETIMTRARVAMPVELTKVLFAVARACRKKQEYDDRVAGIQVTRGCPKVDIWDLAVMAILRAHDFLSYEELQARIDRYTTEGDDLGPYLHKRFNYKRVIEAMNGYTKSEDAAECAKADMRLTIALEKMRDVLLPLFREITTVALCDGMTLSTAATDNSRTGRLTKTKGAQVTLHVMYEERWGHMIAWRLTWYQHGTGSGESPQFPYLLKTTKEHCPAVKVIMGDGSYGSAKSRALCLLAGVELFCELREAQFDGSSALKFLSKAQIEGEKLRCSLQNPLFRQLYPFRNRVEGWNNVTRESGRNLISRVDISRRPKTKVEQLKENPLRADLNLPDDQEEADRFISREQFVGRAAHNEMLCRQVLSLARATVRCQEWYRTEVDFMIPIPFKPRPEDAEFSVFRPRIGLAPTG